MSSYKLFISTYRVLFHERKISPSVAKKTRKRIKRFMRFVWYEAQGEKSWVLNESGGYRENVCVCESESGGGGVHNSAS